MGNTIFMVGFYGALLVALSILVAFEYARSRKSTRFSHSVSSPAGVTQISERPARDSGRRR